MSMKKDNNLSVFEKYPIPLVAKQLELLEWRKIRGRPRGSQDFKARQKRLDIYGAKGPEVRESIKWWNTRFKRSREKWEDYIPEVTEVNDG